MDWLPSSRKLYGWLLRAYPAEFREEYGAQMEFVVVESAAMDHHAPLWLMLLGDVARNAPREHLHILWRDLRNSLRLFAKSRAWTATALLALALGIGAAVSTFSIIDTVLLRSLPFGEAERLAYLWAPLPRYPAVPRERGPSFADVLAYREESRSFSSITAFRVRMLTLNDGGEASRVGTSATSTTKTRRNRKSTNSTATSTATSAAPASVPTATPAPTGKSAKAQSEPVNNASDAEITVAKTSGKVWVNTSSGTYHKGGRYYGKTKQGKFMTEDDAKKAGYHEAKGEIGAKKM